MYLSFILFKRNFIPPKLYFNVQKPYRTICNKELLSIQSSISKAMLCIKVKIHFCHSAYSIFSSKCLECRYTLIEFKKPWNHFRENARDRTRGKYFPLVSAQIAPCILLSKVLNGRLHSSQTVIVRSISHTLRKLYLARLF